MKMIKNLQKINFPIFQCLGHIKFNRLFESHTKRQVQQFTCGWKIIWCPIIFVVTCTATVTEVHCWRPSFRQSEGSGCSNSWARGELPNTAKHFENARFPLSKQIFQMQLWFWARERLIFSILAQWSFFIFKFGDISLSTFCDRSGRIFRETRIARRPPPRTGSPAATAAAGKSVDEELAALAVATLHAHPRHRRFSGVFRSASCVRFLRMMWPWFVSFFEEEFGSRGK